MIMHSMLSYIQIKGDYFLDIKRKRRSIVIRVDKKEVNKEGREKVG